jgi:hypothetical protein
MKKIIFVFLLLLSFNVFPQAEYVNVGNRIYDFLERMDNLQLIENYNSFEMPKTRKEIANYLSQIIDTSNQLDEADLRMLEDFKVEFEYELFGALENSQSLIGSGEYDFISQKEKYFYYFSQKSKMTLFVNLIADGEIILNKSSDIDNTNSATLLNIGGELRGTVLDKVGFYLRGTNGVAAGDCNTAMLQKQLQYNFKFNEKPDEKFFDETQAYVTADFDLVKLKLGRDRINLGYGTNKSIMDNNSPFFDYLSFKIDYGFFNFSYFHGKLLGETETIEDSISGDYYFVTEKYVVYHRMGFNISSHFNFGVGELVVYGDRPFDLSYLVPFSFYKSIEHSNQDRDNAMLFFDFTNYSIPHTKMYLTFLIDDVSFEKIGTGWWGNQTLFNIGIQSSPFYKSIPLDLKFEYMRLEPYTYSHRLIRNNFTHFGYNLSSFLQPNSELFFLGISYRFTNRLTLTADFSYSNHGANVINDDGTIKNVGGDINLGHRTFDSETTKFLDGLLENSRSISTRIFYEPFNQISFFLNASYLSNSSKESQSLSDTQIFIGTNLKF